RCTASSIGVRETRRIIGEYMLTEEDILSGRSFDDVIARNNAPMDIHSPTDGKQKWVQVKPYDIPYRCLVPQIIDYLLVSGRCISSTHKAFASTRFMPCCMATGQAAGIAAALSVKNKVTPRQLDVIKLQKALRKQGAII
ncbi:MAG: FAD-dependent oxidoreductase, partial [Candidatus Aminicenantes bacterium]|nr:FAD-dependent oxidoreductase [Candidatus Aminicenantes bacterium]